MILILHAGAGFHHQKRFKDYKKAMTEISDFVMNQVKAGCSSTEAVALAVSLLEDCSLTNAGIAGSNFTLDGSIESDACIMDDEGWFASIGAVPMCSSLLEDEDHKATSVIHPNPIRIAQSLLDHARKGPDEAGRQPPIMLMGESAHVFAQSHLLSGMIARSDGKSRIHQNQIDRYYSHMAILQNAGNRVDSAPATKRVKLQSDEILQDTVGAICIDDKGRMAVGCSSGGISLKRPGRVGEAAIPGSGIHLDKSDPGGDIKVATTLSGTGEQIMKTFLASRITDIFIKEAVDDADAIGQGLRNLIETRFLQSKLLEKDYKDERNMGAIIVRQIEEKYIEFCWVHSTPSFCFSVHDGSKTSVSISRLNPSRNIQIGARVLKKNACL